MTRKRRRQLTIDILEYIATHMEEVLNVEGPHEMVNDDEEDKYLINMFQHEAEKLRVRANRLRSGTRASIGAA